MTGHANSSWNVSDGPVDNQLERSCELYSFIIYTVFVGTLVVVGVIGNSFAFVVFWKDNIKTSASFLFQGLSLIDSALLLAVLPLYSIESFVVYTGWLKGYLAISPYVLVYLLPLALTAQTATIWVTVLVAVNRYIAVCLPYRASRLCTVLKAKKQLAFVLLFAVLYNIPKFAEYRVEYVTTDNGTTYTATAGYTTLGSSKLYYIIYGNILYLIFLLALPIFILTLLNIRLIKALKALRRKRMEMQSLRQQQDNNVTFVLIIVVIVFIICQVPALVNQVMWNVAPDEARTCGGFQFYLRNIANMLVILNSAVNFIIYILFNKRFRHVLIQTVCAYGLLPGDIKSGKSTGNSPQMTVTPPVWVFSGEEERE
ncbi:FMRFamide receptor, partial [Lamellibrachia satsuma]